MENEIQVLNTEIVRDTQLESQVDIAKRYPRDLKRVISNSIAIVTMDKETAETCNYDLPRGKKTISGASVHLARIIVQQYGNVRIESRTTGSDRTQVHAEAVCFDLENNIAVKVSVSKSILYSKNHKYTPGKRFDEDMVIMTGKVAAAIAYRNAVLSVVPKAVTDKVYNAAMNKITGSITTEQELIKRRNDAFERFKNDYTVTEQEILEYLGLNTINQIKQQEIVKMIGMFNSLKEGEFTVEGMFKRKKQPETKQITPKVFNKILSDLKAYNISLKAVKQEYKDSDLTKEQMIKITEAGTITDDRFDEIIKLVIDGEKLITYFEFYLDEEHFKELENTYFEHLRNNPE